jgi:predicted permease
MSVDSLIFFFLMLAIGYGVARLKLVPEQTADTLPGVLLNICYPAMVLHTFTSTDPQVLLHTGLPAAIATLVITLALSLGSLLLFRRAPKARRAYWCFVSGVGNVSYAAIPLLSVFLSEDAMLLCVIHSAVQDLLIWSLYHSLFLGTFTGSRRELIKKVFTSPALLAAIAGLLLAVFRIRLPSFLQTTVTTLSGMTSPLALLLLGMLICRYGALSWRKDRQAILYSLLKVLAVPVVLFCLLRCVLDTRTALLLAILFGSPAPLTGVVWSKAYGGDAELAVHCTIASTLLFLPLMSAVLFFLRSAAILS